MSGCGTRNRGRCKCNQLLIGRRAYKETVKDGWEYEIVVTPKTLDERAFGLIRIRTDSKHAKHQSYQCFAVVRRPVAPRPKVLPAPGSPARRATPPGRQIQ